MLSASRTALMAIILAASVAVAHAQTQDQDHAAHHPTGQAGQPATPAPSPSPGMAMPGMPQGQSGGMSMMGGNQGSMMSMPAMMEMMRRMMGASEGPGAGNPAGITLFRHIEGQLAYYKAELGITDAQLPQWNAFANVARASAKILEQPYIQSMQTGASVSAPEQLDRRMAMLSALIETEKSVGAAFKSLYAVLSPEQKTAADEMVAEHLQAMRAAGL
jgi:hypothetical protein